MSLTWKLILGFLFAIVLQVAQLLIGAHFTRQLLSASVQVSDALAASLAVQSGIDAVRTLQQRIEVDDAGNHAATAVYRVFVEEVAARGGELQHFLDGEGDAPVSAFDSALADVQEHLKAIEAGADGDTTARRDALGFLSDGCHDLEQALLQAQVRVRGIAAAGVARERDVHDLPERAGIVTMAGGLLLMALFVAWFSRQLVVPIQQAWAELEGRVAERTVELVATHDRLLVVNRELSAAKDAAEAANRSKTQFLANISHELRTPMTAILGYTEILQDRLGGRANSSIEHESLETIRRNGQHLVCIVGDLLDMAKLEAGKLAVEVRPCEPLRVAEEVVELLRPKAQAKGITLDLVVSEPVPVTIASDPLRLRQILVNLVDNAIKFTAAGGVRLAVEGLAAGAQRLQFAVVDSGVGMAPDVLERLFRPFEQADVSTTRRFGGTGLGLAISRQLAQLLGGDIVATSSPGGGSTFRLAVATGPLDGVPLQGRRDERTPVPAPSTPAPAATLSARVLLVEDGPDNQRLIRHILQRSGCRVELAGNGQEGLERMTAGPGAFDIVLMDMQMPVMDGVTATRELRQRGVRTPIVALTANAMAADEQACLQAGCDAFLTKPIDRKKLLATIGSLVATRA